MMYAAGWDALEHPPYAAVTAHLESVQAKPDVLGWDATGQQVCASITMLIRQHAKARTDVGGTDALERQMLAAVIIHQTKVDAIHNQDVIG